MHRRLIVISLLSAVFVVTPAFAQFGYPSCTGQPVLTGDQTGTVSLSAYASFTPYSDTIDTTTGTGCEPAAGLPDSVVCFTPETPCSVTPSHFTERYPDVSQCSHRLQ